MGRAGALLPHEPSHQRGLLATASHIVQQEGVAGLYRGLGATLLQVSRVCVCVCVCVCMRLVVL